MSRILIEPATFTIWFDSKIQHQASTNEVERWARDNIYVTANVVGWTDLPQNNFLEEDWIPNFIRATQTQILLGLGRCTANFRIFHNNTGCWCLKIIEKADGKGEQISFYLRGIQHENLICSCNRVIVSDLTIHPFKRGCKNLCIRGIQITKHLWKGKFGYQEIEW